MNYPLYYLDQHNQFCINLLTRIFLTRIMLNLYKLADQNYPLCFLDQHNTFCINLLRNYDSLLKNFTRNFNFKTFDTFTNVNIISIQLCSDKVRGKFQVITDDDYENT